MIALLWKPPISHNPNHVGDLQAEFEGRDSHGHRQRSLFGVGAGERHPCDVQGMRECSKDLSPDHAKVSDPAEVGAKGREGAVENVADQMACKASHDRLAALVAIAMSAMSPILGRRRGTYNRSEM